MDDQQYSEHIRHKTTKDLKVLFWYLVILGIITLITAICHKDLLCMHITSGMLLFLTIVSPNKKTS